MESQTAKETVVSRARRSQDGGKDLAGVADGGGLVRLTRLTVYLLITAIFMIGALSLYRWAQTANEPPKSFYELQLRKWQGVVGDNPTNPLAHLNLGYVYYKGGDDGAAYKEFNSVLRFDAKNPMAHYYLGMLARKNGQAQTAIDELTRALDLAKGKNKLLPSFALGEMYEKQKKLVKAAGLYRQAVEANDMYWNANFALARVYEKLGKKTEALAQYKAAGRFNPDSRIQSAIKRLAK